MRTIMSGYPNVSRPRRNDPRRNFSLTHLSDEKQNVGAMMPCTTAGSIQRLASTFNQTRQLRNDRTQTNKQTYGRLHNQNVKKRAWPFAHRHTHTRTVACLCPKVGWHDLVFGIVFLVGEGRKKGKFKGYNNTSLKNHHIMTGVIVSPFWPRTCYTPVSSHCTQVAFIGSLFFCSASNRFFSFLLSSSVVSTRVSMAQHSGEQQIITTQHTPVLELDTKVAASRDVQNILARLSVCLPARLSCYHQQRIIPPAHPPVAGLFLLRFVSSRSFRFFRAAKTCLLCWAIMSVR